MRHYTRCRAGVVSERFNTIIVKSHLFSLIIIVFSTIFQISEASAPRFAFVVNSFNNSISQYIVDNNAGRLIPNGLVSVNQFPSAIAVHPSNKYVFTTAQAPAELQVYSLDNTNGRLTEIEGSPFPSQVISPFAITFANNGRFVYVAGRLSDNIMGFSFNENTAELKPIEGMPVKAVSRPRQFVIHPSGKYLYAVNTHADNVSAFSVDQTTGLLQKIPGSPYDVGEAPVDMMLKMSEIPEGITQGPYNLAIHPSGKLLFVMNWMSASISVFKLNENNGTLSAVPGSPFKSDPHPYGAVASPDGRYLYSYHWPANTIVGFVISLPSGKLQRLDKTVKSLGIAPVDDWFDESSNFLYVSHYFTHNIASYVYDPGSGDLNMNKSTPARYGARSISVSYGEEQIRFSSGVLYMLSEKGNLLSAYKTSGFSGELQPIASVQITGNPKALAYDKTNNLVYVVTQEPNQLLVYGLVNDKELRLQTELPISMQQTPDSVAVGVNGLVVYVTSAAHDRLLVFERHPQSGEIKEWPESPRSTASYPTDILLDPVGRFAYVLNAKSNSISSYKFRDGLWPLVDKIPTPERLGNENSRITAMATDPAGNFIYAADAAGDKVLVYWVNYQTGSFDKSTKAKELKDSFFTVGNNPVGLEFHPNGEWLYVVNSGDNTIGVYLINHINGMPDGKIQTITTAKLLQAIEIDASGRFAYARYKDSGVISIYTINPSNGELQHHNDIKTKVPVVDFAIDTVLH